MCLTYRPADSYCFLYFLSVQAIESTIGPNAYQHNKVNQWTSNVVEQCLNQLTKLGKPFKYIGKLLKSESLMICHCSTLIKVFRRHENHVRVMTLLGVLTCTLFVTDCLYCSNVCCSLKSLESKASVLLYRGHNCFEYWSTYWRKNTLKMT